MIEKKNIQFVFLEIKDYLIKADVPLNESKFLNIMVDFFASNTSNDIWITDIKKKFYEILNNTKTNQVIFIIR